MPDSAQVFPAALIGAALWGGVLMFGAVAYGLGLLSMATVFSLVPLPRPA